MDTERERQMKKVQMYGLAQHDAALFLDTHPQNKDALDYYEKVNTMFMAASHEYISKYGPLEKGAGSAETPKWDWINGPWPWEGEKR